MAKLEEELKAESERRRKRQRGGGCLLRRGLREEQVTPAGEGG